MLDINYIRAHPEELAQNIKNRGLSGDQFAVEKLLELDRQRIDLLQQVETLRSQRNKLARKSAKLKQRQLLVRQGRQIKKELKRLESRLSEVEKQWQVRMDFMPNLTHPAMPVGRDEGDNIEIKRWGETVRFDFAARHHLALGEALDLIDVQKSGEVAGSRFYFLKNEAVLLQRGIFDLMLKKLLAEGFSPIIPPVILKYRPLYGTGYFPSEEDQIYELKVEADKIEDRQRRFLAGTSEQAIVAYHADEVLSIDDNAPLKYAGISTCFRSEAGSWGKDVRGIKRVHQFDKVEMIYFATPSSSQKYMQEARQLEEWILQKLNLPYRVLEMCTGDVGLATYRKFDLEVWLPSCGEWMETHSNSDLGAYHARRLKIKYQKAGGAGTDYVHTISATGITNTRPLAAILDNFQQPDGSVVVPEVLREYVGKEVIA